MCSPSGSARNGALLEAPAACAALCRRAQREPRLRPRRAGEHFQQSSPGAGPDKGVEVQGWAGMSSTDPGLDPRGAAQGEVGLICCGERTAQSAQGRGVRCRSVAQ